MRRPAIPADTSKHSALVLLAATATRGPPGIEYRWLNAARKDAPVAVFLHAGLGSLAMWKGWPQTICDQLGMRGKLGRFHADVDSAFYGWNDIQARWRRSKQLPATCRMRSSQGSKHADTRRIATRRRR